MWAGTAFTILAKFVRITIGSDQHRSTSIPESPAIHDAGLMRPAALLRALTTDAAATIFPQRGPFGLADGTPADFLILHAKPPADFNAITRIDRRVKGGQELRLDQVPEEGACSSPSSQAIEAA